MRIDEFGLPVVEGATDKQDSAVIAGLMTIFKFPLRVDMTIYILTAGTSIKDRDSEIQHIFKNTIYVRHPHEYKYDLSRDQFILLSAALYTQGRTDLINIDFINGRDILSPAVKGHVSRCKGHKANWFQDAWLWFDVWYHAKFNQIGEPNQILGMMLVADKKYLKWWVANNPQWQRSIEKYWYTEDGSWRYESTLALWMIAYINVEVEEV